MVELCTWGLITPGYNNYTPSGFIFDLSFFQKASSFLQTLSLANILGTRKPHFNPESWTKVAFFKIQDLVIKGLRAHRRRQAWRLYSLKCTCQRRCGIVWKSNDVRKRGCLRYDRKPGFFLTNTYCIFFPGWFCKCAENEICCSYFKRYAKTEYNARFRLMIGE